jgi:hypothetical protein
MIDDIISPNPGRLGLPGPRSILAGGSPWMTYACVPGVSFVRLEEGPSCECMGERVFHRRGRTADRTCRCRQNRGAVLERGSPLCVASISLSVWSQFKPDIVSVQDPFLQTIPVACASFVPHRWRLVVTAAGRSSALTGDANLRHGSASCSCERTRRHLSAASSGSR